LNNSVAANSKEPVSHKALKKRCLEESLTMSEPEQEQSYVELFDVSKNAPIAKAPLAGITHLPRAGERIFLRHPITGDWEAYIVMNIEYFLAGEPAGSDGSLESLGMVRITVFVERSR